MRGPSVLSTAKATAHSSPASSAPEEKKSSMKIVDLCSVPLPNDRER